MDKLKEVGGKAMKGALTMAATSYGTVTEGKYKLCKISMNSAHDKLTFIKVAAIEGEHVIREDIKTFKLLSEGNDLYLIELEFNDGETSRVALSADKDQGSALPTAQERLAAQYNGMAKFLEALAKHVPAISDGTKDWVNKIMRYASRPEI